MGTALGAASAFIDNGQFEKSEIYGRRCLSVRVAENTEWWK